MSLLTGDEVYLGDAVYASFDGCMLKLRTGDGNNQVIYLEQEVYEALLGFVAALTQARLHPKEES